MSDSRPELDGRQREMEPDGGREIAALLLVLQGAFGLLSALGLVVFARLAFASGQLGGRLLFALGVPMLALGLAAGVAGGMRRARIAACVFEGLILLGAALRLAISGGSEAALVPLLTTVLLPLVVMALVLGPALRALAARHASVRGAGAESSRVIAATAGRRAG